MTKVVQTKKTTLHGSGCTSTATSIILSTLKLPDGSTNVTMADFGSIGYATIEPGTAREEQISFTGITQNVNRTATLTGVTRGLRFVSPYDEVSANKYAHAGGATIVFSNTAGFYEKFTVNVEDETITGEWDFPTPVNDNNAATKKYVDDLALGGSTSINRVVVSGNAGESVVEGDIVYQKVLDSEWYKADADLIATLSGVQLGVAQGTGSDGVAITGGILIYGIADNFSGLTANTEYYVSNTAGAVSTTTGTISVKVGLATSTTAISVDFRKPNEPNRFVSTSAGAGDAGHGVVLNAGGILDGSLLQYFGDGSDGDVTISSPTTLTRDMYYDDLTVNSTLTTDGYRIFVKGTLSGTGTITWGTPTAGSGITGGVAGGTGILRNNAGVNGQTGGANLLDTTSGTAGNNGYIGSSGATGGAGGSAGSGSSSGGAGGSNNSKIKYGIEKWNTLSFLDFNGITPILRLPAGSGSGAAGRTGSGSYGTYTRGNGGGSGASGGIIFVACNIFGGAITFNVVGANGGNGGNSTNSSSGAIGGGGGGAGGNGGVVVVVFASKTGTPTYTLTGGTGGTGGTGDKGGATGASGSNGATGTSYEIPITGLI